VQQRMTISQLVNKPPPLTTQNEVLNYALAIHDVYINPESANVLQEVHLSVLQQVSNKLLALQSYGSLSHSLGHSATIIMGSFVVGIYDQTRRIVYSSLIADYNALMNTRDFRSIMAYENTAGGNRSARSGAGGLHESSSGEYNRGAVHENYMTGGTSLSTDNRVVEPFDSSMVPQFMLKIKGQKESKCIKLSKKNTVLTIGRDKSNSMILEDSRVSRSHARIEWNEQQCTCEYIDLGSSCGSKLNGKAVQRAKLQPGDVLELGQSTLIFQLKKKKRFSLLGL
jgi:hypothetical protein